MYLTPKKRIGSLIAAAAINMLDGLPVMAQNSSNQIITDKERNVKTVDMGYLSHSADTFLIVVFAGIIGFLLILSLYFSIIVPFLNEREYIKMEMQRSDGTEYNFWKEKLKKLYIKHIPIIGRFFR